MIVRVRDYSSFEEALAEWRNFKLPSVVESEDDLFNLQFFFAESKDEEEVERLAFVAEDFGGDAWHCGSERVHRVMMAFERGVLQAPACRKPQASGYNAIWSALSNYLSPAPSSVKMIKGELKLDRTLVMGILNVTPDSFSDGGKYLKKEDAVKRALEMVEEGADLIDVGGESTRPRSEPVPIEEERRRVIPVIKEISSSIGVPVSIDSRHPQVAREALQAGAAMINDVGGLRDPEMIRLASETKAPVIMMHMLGEPRTMQQNPEYEDVVGDISMFLEDRMRAALRAGVEAKRMILDPGIGFGKTVQHNLQIINRLREFKSLGRPLLVGGSRKSFIGKLLGEGGNLEGSLAIAAASIMNGASILRVHDVKETVRIARTLDAVIKAG